MFHTKLRYFNTSFALQQGFLFNAFCFLVLIAALLAWRREAAPPRGPRESLGASL